MNIRRDLLIIDLDLPPLLLRDFIQDCRMPLTHFRADLLPRGSLVKFFTHFKMLLRTIGYPFRVIPPQEQQPDDLFVLARDTHVRAMFTFLWMGYERTSTPAPE
jgi:hypothetical protein